jgi:HNH endonuclease
VNPSYPAVAERAGERCEYCHAPERVFNFAFEVEHIVPRAAGGENLADNMALACESCNLYKSDATTGADPEEGRQVRLFHPRRDRWDEHFAFDGETGELHGLTAVGRATVARLRMNSAFQLRARQHWTQLGLYP